tara:strand:- start:901 stop:1113 length:213 start_codon:yes stop_codon:yes gene_type:complete
MTYGTYQKEGVPKIDQTFYDEDVNQIISHKIAGSFHWELNLLSCKIGDVNIKLTVNRVLTDTGSSMLRLP